MQLPQIDTRYGAPMGRASNGNPEEGGKLHLCHLPLDSGGYDKGGAYWGLRSPVTREVECRPIGSDKSIVRRITATPRIYRYWNDIGTVEGTLDAFSRMDAKAQLLTEFPAIQFLR